jgi:hypothetical protein
LAVPIMETVCEERNALAIFWTHTSRLGMTERLSAGLDVAGSKLSSAAYTRLES